MPTGGCEDGRKAEAALESCEGRSFLLSVCLSKGGLYIGVTRHVYASLRQLFLAFSRVVPSSLTEFVVDPILIGLVARRSSSLFRF